MQSATAGSLTSRDMDDLFGLDKPLGAASARLRTAHAFGLISSRARDQALLLNKVRNEFAHSIEELDFDSPVISKLVDQMSFTLKEAMDWLRVDNPRPEPGDDGAFLFDGERFEEAFAFVADNAVDVLFFLPEIVPTNREERLRHHIYACVLGAGGLGLKGWIEDSAAAGGIAQLSH